MKRIYLLVVAMCCMVLSQPLMAKDLFKFCGTMITTDNYKSIDNYKSQGATGSVTVDISNGLVINLINFSCLTQDTIFIFNNIEATIRVVNYCEVNLFDQWSFTTKPFITALDSRITITGSETDTLAIGDGKIDVKVNKLEEYHTYASKLAITGGCNLILFKRPEAGIDKELSIMGDGSELEIADGSTVIVDGDGENSTISGFKKVKLDGCEVYSPASASYDDFNYRYDLYGAPITSRIIIGPEGNETYFSFCDILVNDVNYTKIQDYASAYIKEGQVRVTIDGDFVSCDLTNAKIDCTTAAEPVAFKMMYDYGVKIYLKGANSIKAGSWAIYNAFGNNSSIWGQYDNGFASLNIEHGYITMYRAPFTINNCVLTVAGDGEYTIVGSKDPAEILHMYGGKITLKPATYGTIQGIADLDTKYGKFVYPADATYDTEKMQLMSQGEIVKTDVVFEGNNTAIEQISKENENLQKVMIDGQVYIIRDNAKYNVLGQQVEF